MLEQIERRRTENQLSLRTIANQLGVSHTLLSLVLSRKRKPSRDLQRRMGVWLRRLDGTDGSYEPPVVIGRFITERESHVSPKTVRFYQQMLEPFAQWCHKQELTNIRSVSRADVAGFLSYVRNRRSRQLSAGSLKLYHQALNTLFKYVGQTCEVEAGWTNPLTDLKVKPSQAQAMEFSDTEIAEIVSIVRRRDDELLRLRNEAIVTVLLNSGLRLSELLALDAKQVGEDGRVKVIGKGGKQRVVTVGRSGLKVIGIYLERRGDSRGALWQTHEGNRLTEWGLRSLFARIEAASPTMFTDGVYAHRFRHTAITRLLRARVPLRSVQRYAGHSDPQTTLRYAQALDADEAIAAVDQLACEILPDSPNSVEIR